MVGINSSTHVYGAGSKPLISGTPFLVGFAKRLSKEYATALNEALETATGTATAALQKAAEQSGTEWADIKGSLEAWYQSDTDSLHMGIRNGADDAALAMKLEYGDNDQYAPSPLLRSTSLTYKDTFAKHVSILLDKSLSKGIK